MVRIDSLFNLQRQSLNSQLLRYCLPNRVPWVAFHQLFLRRQTLISRFLLPVSGRLIPGVRRLTVKRGFSLALKNTLMNKKIIYNTSSISCCITTALTRYTFGPYASKVNSETHLSSITKVV